MKFTVERSKLRNVLSIIKPVVSTFDIIGLTDSLYMEITNDILLIRAVGDGVHISTEMKVESEEDVKFLINAPKFIHLIGLSTVDKIEFTLSGDDIQKGEGALKVKANSTSVFPLRSMVSYPDQPDFNSVRYAALDDDFIESLLLASNYVDKSAQNFKGGVCVTGKHIIATTGLKGIVIKKDVPTRPFLIRPSVIKPLIGLDMLTIGEIRQDDLNLIAFNGINDDAIINVSVLEINDSFPYKEMLDQVHKWATSKTCKVGTSNKELSHAISRMGGFVSNEYKKIDVSIKSNSMVLDYTFQGYDNKEVLGCTANDETEFSIKIDSLQEIVKMFDDKIEFEVSIEYNILFAKTKEWFVIAQLMRG